MVTRSNARQRALRADIPVVVEFRTPMSPEQQQWLRTTRVRVRRVAFDVNDTASAALLHDQSTLVGLCTESLQRVEQ